MPQVAARINNEQEKWLKDYFRHQKCRGGIYPAVGG